MKCDTEEESKDDVQRKKADEPIGLIPLSLSLTWRSDATMIDKSFGRTDLCVTGEYGGDE